MHSYAKKWDGITPRHYLINTLFIPKPKSKLFDFVCIHNLWVVCLSEKSRDLKLLQVFLFPFIQNSSIVHRSFCELRRVFEKASSFSCPLHTQKKWQQCTDHKKVSKAVCRELNLLHSSQDTSGRSTSCKVLLQLEKNEQGNLTASFLKQVSHRTLWEKRINITVLFHPLCPPSAWESGQMPCCVGWGCLQHDRNSF